MARLILILLNLLPCISFSVNVFSGVDPTSAPPGYFDDLDTLSQGRRETILSKQGLSIDWDFFAREQIQYAKLVRFAFSRFVEQVSDDGNLLVEIGCADGSGIAACLLGLKNFKMVGFDKDPAMILSAKRNEKFFPNIMFIQQDLAQTLFITNDSKADVVLMRHPEPGKGTETWARITINAVKFVRLGGLLILTAYSRGDYRFFDEIFTNVDTGLEMIHSGDNPFFDSNVIEYSETESLGRDKYLIIMQRPR